MFKFSHDQSIYVSLLQWLSYLRQLTHVRASRYISVWLHLALNFLFNFFIFHTLAWIIKSHKISIHNLIKQRCGCNSKLHLRQLTRSGLLVLKYYVITKSTNPGSKSWNRVLYLNRNQSHFRSGGTLGYGWLFLMDFHIVFTVYVYDKFFLIMNPLPTFDTFNTELPCLGDDTDESFKIKQNCKTKQNTNFVVA